MFAFAGCNSSGGGSSSNDKNKGEQPEPVDPCAGPVPCMDTDWSNQYAVFYDSKGDPYIIGSDGKTTAIAGFWTKEGDRALIVFEISQVTCRSGILTWGAIDANEDGVFDLILSGVTGNLEICDELLEIFDVDCNEYSPSPFYDIMAWYDGMSSLSTSNVLSTEMPIGTVEIDAVKIRINLVKEILNKGK